MKMLPAEVIWYCGAPSVRGTCRIRVPVEGLRCGHHRDGPTPRAAETEAHRAMDDAIAGLRDMSPRMLTLLDTAIAQLERAAMLAEEAKDHGTAVAAGRDMGRLSLAAVQAAAKLAGYGDGTAGDAVPPVVIELPVCPSCDAALVCPVCG